MPFAILAHGTAVPDRVVTQEAAVAIAKAQFRAAGQPDEWLTGLFEKSGIRARRVVACPPDPTAAVNGAVDCLTNGSNGHELNGFGPSTGARMQQYEQEAGPLAMEACQWALDESGLKPSTITHLITVSCTGFRAPGVDYELINGLGLPPTTERTHVGFMGCHGALNGLRVANGLAAAHPDARILLCATELCSIHHQYRGEPQQMVSSALFADASAAVVGVGAVHAPQDSWKVAATGSYLFAGTADAMTWTIKDHGFEMTLARRVPDLIAQNLAPWMKDWLSRQRLKIEDVRSWAMHPGGPKILEAAAEALGLSAERLAESHAVFAEYGNLSSPTLLFIIERLRRRSAPLPCVALGFGPGLVAEAVLFR